MPRGSMLIAGAVAAGCVAAGCITAAAAAAGTAAHRQAARPAAREASARRPGAKAAKDAKKGVAVWAFDGVTKALAESGSSWYYTWATNHPGITSPRRVSFVPMIWGAGTVTAANLRRVRHEGHYLLGFNEPDSSSQSNLTVPHALALWPKLMATGMKLGSPAVATDAVTPGGWLDRFMRGAKHRHYRINFITVHWYGGDFATAAAVGQLKSYLQAIHARYHRPIWLTEFALIRFGATATFPSPRLQAAFVTGAGRMLQRLAFVQRYAWFALPANSGDGSAGLFRGGPVATTAGRAFEAIRG